MKKIKSVVTFLRRQMDVRGKSEHNGRGRYDMEIDDNNLELHELIERFEKRLKEWQEKGIVEKVERGDRYIAVTLKKDAVEEAYWYYRTMVVGLDAFVLQVHFSSPNHPDE